jgi:hypothetical protein
MKSNKTYTKRRSVCVDCGIRLSAITASGSVKWRPSQVNDEGLYCQECYKKNHPAPKNNKGIRSK